MKNKESGFTLIELLVAMTIIAVLIGFALVSYQGARKAARDGKRKTDLEEVRSALEMCFSDNGSYPTGSLVSGDNITCATVTYITIPDDPIESWDYIYEGAADSYKLCASMETESSTVTCTGSCGTGVACNYEVNNP